MTKIIVSMIFAMIFIIASFSRPLIPCETEGWHLCKLEGVQNYYGTMNLSNPWYAGGLSFIFIFLISLLLLSLIFKRQKVVV